MKPRERETSGQHDLFRSRLDQILDMGHAKVVLASLMDWHFLSSKLGEVYSDGPGQPPLATRLMAGLHILKYADNLSDDEVCARAGWRTPITNTSAVRSSSATIFPWTARP